MKRVFLSSVALLSFFAIAEAADLPMRSAAPLPYAAPAFTWTGFYVGVNAGAAWDDSRLRLTPDADSFDDPLLSSDDFRFLSDRQGKGDTGFTGGGQIGYNHQFGSLVLGVEADINSVDLDRSRHRREDFSDSFSGGLAGLVPLFTGESMVYETRLRREVDWFGTVRGHVGFAADNALFFVTGGLAYGEVSTHASASAVLPTTFFGTGVYDYSGSQSDTRTGWALGAGLEYALTNNLTLKGEYLHVDLHDHRSRWS